MSADLHAALRQSANANTLQLQVTYGELLAYDPATHTGQFELPLHRDTDSDGNTSNDGVPTGFIQCGTMFSGPGYGMQFHPPVGAQALIMFIDVGKMLPIAAVFLANDVEHPPFPDGKSHGWKDEHGSSHTTTTDGATSGDNAGAARSFGNKYTATSTTSGHQFTQDDVAKRVANLTAGGHSHVFDDAARQIKMATSGGHIDLFDDAGRIISRVTSGGLQTIHSDATDEISHLAPNIGLGAKVANLTSANALVRQSDLTAMANNINNLRRDDLVKLVAAMLAVQVPNVGGTIAQLAQLVGITVPSGSSVVKSI